MHHAQEKVKVVHHKLMNKLPARAAEGLQVRQRVVSSCAPDEHELTEDPVPRLRGQGVYVRLVAAMEAAEERHSAPMGVLVHLHAASPATRPRRVGTQ